MGKPIYDKDYCVTGISSEKFTELFSNAMKRGKFFEVFDIDGTEFALARRERKIGVGHKEFEIDTENVTIEEDLARRDITINAIPNPTPNNRPAKLDISVLAFCKFCVSAPPCAP